MLAKQVWRLLTNSQSLMTKTLKHKYFPNSDLMDATVPASASFTWRSLMATRDLISKGARKLIGSGLTIEYVAELISDGEWDSNILASHFLEWEVNEILKIPIPRFGEVDSWTWHYTKTGDFSVISDFSVRSAYHAVLEATKNSFPSTSIPPHNAIWSSL
uniref:Uncharacterized protein n=1 Tax=Chenopodium quinoa TaxID=63459 RepID=A0A803L5T9_CHEQI